MSKLVIISDAHVLDGTDSVERFNAMLDLIASTRYDVCFLGDIMELWMGHRRFETPEQIYFRDWCKEQREKRRVLFIEGNHEFFVLRLHSDCFSDFSTEVLRLPSGDCFLHGDQVQCNKWSNRIFRYVLNCNLMYWILKLFPFAPFFVKMSKRALEFKNRNRKPHFPNRRICQWCENEFRKGARRVFMGHFHHRRQKVYRSGDLWQVLPDWKTTGKVLFYDTENHQADILSWQDIPVTNRTPAAKKRI